MAINLKQLFLSNQTGSQILVKNTFWLGLNEVFSKLIMFFVTIMLGRYLGLNNFGIFNYVFSYVAVLMIFSDLGVMSIVIREIAKNKSKAEEYIGNSLGIRIATSVIILLLMLLSIPIFNPDKSYVFLIILATGYSLSLQFQGILTSVLIAFEKMEYVFICRLFYYLGILAVALIVVKFDMGMNTLIGGYFAIGIISIAIALIPLKVLNIKVKILGNTAFWKTMLRESFPLFGFIACSQLYLNLDTIIIGKFFSNQEVGLYSAAYKILLAFQSVNIVNSATFSRITILNYENKFKNLNKLIKIIVLGSLLVLVPLATLISINSELIMRHIWSNGKFVMAAPVLSFLIWAGVINYFRIFSTNILIAKGQQKFVFYSIFIGLSVNAGLNLFVTPQLGYSFSAIALLISEITILVSTLIFIKTNKAIDYRVKKGNDIHALP